MGKKAVLYVGMSPTYSIFLPLNFFMSLIFSIFMQLVPVLYVRMSVVCEK